MKSFSRHHFPDHISIGLIFAIISGTYWWERSRGPGWGDSLSFLLSALQGFSWSVNATSHFLYTNLNTALTGVFPGMDPVPLLTTVSIVFALLTLVRLYQTASALTGNRFGALMAVIAFGLSFTFWRQAEQIEVYTCSGFFTLSAIHLISADVTSREYRHMPAVGIWFGLALLVHIQTVLLIPFYCSYLFIAWRKNHEIRTLVLSLAAFGSALLLLIVPAAILPNYTVGSVFFSFGFREEVFHFSIPSLLTGFATSLGYLAYSFHVHLLALAIGAAACFRKDPSTGYLFLAGMIPVWAFAMRYPVSDQYVFFMNAYIFVALLCGYGYAQLASRVTSCLAQSLILAGALAASPIVYEVSLRTALHIPRLETFHQRKAYKGGLAYYLWPGLRKIPDFTAAYLTQAETGSAPETIEPELWSRLLENAGAYYSLLKTRE